MIGKSLPSRTRFFKAWKQSQEEVQKSSYLSEHLNYNALKGYYRFFAQWCQKYTAYWSFKLIITYIHHPDWPKQRYCRVWTKVFSQTSSQRASSSFPSKQYGISIISLKHWSGHSTLMGMWLEETVSSILSACLFPSAPSPYLFQITSASRCVWAKLHCTRSLSISSDCSHSPFFSHVRRHV